MSLSELIMQNLYRIERDVIGKKLRCAVCHIRFGYHYYVCKEWDEMCARGEKIFVSDDEEDEPTAEWLGFQVRACVLFYHLSNHYTISNYGG